MTPQRSWGRAGRRAALWALLGVLSATAAAAGPPAAEPPATGPPSALLHLDYERTRGARQCMPPGELMRAVEARLGRKVFVAAGSADLQAKLRADRSAGAFQIELELFDRSRRSLGRRQLRTRARHCSALDDSLALVLSLAADVAAPPAPAPRENPLAAAAAQQQSSIEIPSSTVAPRAPWRVRPSLGIAVIGGLVPAPGWGPSAELELTPPHFWPLFVRAAGWLTRRIGSASAGAEFKAQSVELGVCPWAFPIGPLESRWCLEQLIGRVRARGIGFDQKLPGNTVGLALGPQASLSARHGHWFISVSGSLLAPLVSRRYFYDFDGDERTITLHDQGWLWGAANLSLGIEP
jgi:hypothetical protein